jgi:hypothetical protein
MTRLGRAEVGVAAGLGQRAPGIEQARALDEAGLDRHGQAVVGAAGVTHGGEAALQRRLQQHPGVLVQERARHGLQPGEIRVGRHGVEVRVDEAGHEGAALEVDDLSIADLDRCIGNFLHALALDEDVAVLAQSVTEAVEEAAVFEQDHC